MDNPLGKLKDPKIQKVVIPVGIAAVAYILWRYWQAGSTDHSEVEEEPQSANKGEPIGYGQDPSQRTDTVETVTPPPESSENDIPKTNAEWSMKVIDRLVAIGWDPQLVSRAVGQYLNRQGLSQQQVGIIREALALVGQPPVGKYSIIYGYTEPKPAPAPAPAKPAPAPAKPAPAPAKPAPAPAKPAPAPAKPAPAPAKQYVTVVKYTSKNPPWNSTMSGIAKHYGMSLKALAKLNPEVKNLNLIHPGQKIRVK